VLRVATTSSVEITH